MQEFKSSATVVDRNGVLEGIEGGLQGEEDDTKVMEDAGKEDMFVDCPDELGTTGDGKEAVAVAEVKDNLEEQDFHLREANGAQEDFALDELERFRAVLDRTVCEKESVSREYKVRWIMFLSS